MKIQLCASHLIGLWWIVFISVCMCVSLFSRSSERRARVNRNPRRIIRRRKRKKNGTRMNDLGPNLLTTTKILIKNFQEAMKTANGQPMHFRFFFCAIWFLQMNWSVPMDAFLWFVCLPDALIILFILCCRHLARRCARQLKCNHCETKATKWFRASLSHSPPAFVSGSVVAAPYTSLMIQ